MESDNDVRETRGYVVRGRVQGVGFRWFTRDTGHRLGLGGHVCNRSDGAVEVHACGPVSDLDRLEKALRTGPPGARVDTVERIHADPRTPARGFQMEQW